MKRDMNNVYKKILQNLKSGNQLCLSLSELPGVHFNIYVSERCDFLSITTEIPQNPSSLRISVNSKHALSIDESIERYEASIAINVYGTHYTEMHIPFTNEKWRSMNTTLDALCACLQFADEFMPILARFVDETLSPEVVRLHNHAVELNKEALR
ncbi:hypothetical protein L3V77_05060 [Vibrio sp. DW001]|uniref:hypothetical protein n=1 Tax=Vibrio sp. DW001 TaxID=2912315 RepID=UPI0023AF431C|nr:hypothetical protein [Vibrio sp. DW001]WED27607.1 hypothetical protein L3V77_05060 [Vibrio sp. DW001]